MPYSVPCRHALRPLLVLAALAGSLIAAGARATDATDATDDGGLAEIVVTAEKFNSTIQNTPISLSALSGAQLNAAGITSVAALAYEVPGLSMRSAGAGQTEYEARGLASNGGAAPTVGFYLDEVPLSPPALSQVGKVVIDPNLYDVNRIEVLRGPQGTLYGSGSMGGTVKVITNQPRLDTLEGSVQGTLSDTQGGSGNGGGNFMLNIPLGSMFAVRVVAGDTYRSGWLDRVVLNDFPADTTTRGNVLASSVQSVAHNVNTENVYTFRAAVLFQPGEQLSVVASAMYQRLRQGGYDEFDSPPGAAYHAHYEAHPFNESISDTVHIYGLTVTADLDFADLTSATAYWDRFETQTQDASESVSYSNGIYPYLFAPYTEADPSHQFSEELRLSSRGDGRLHWVAGAFYSSLESTWDEYGASAQNTAAPGGVFFQSVNPYTVQQTAVFADGSFKLTDHWKISAGGRYYHYQSQQIENEWGSDAASPVPLTTPFVTKASNSGFNPRINLSYSPTPDVTTYLSASKGFRPGGANQVVPPFADPPHCTPQAPLSFGPDTVWNYELGEKARLFDNRVTLNSDIYYIKWNNVQQAPLLACGYQYDTNAGDGRSFGPELELNARLTEDWSLAASAAYTDAKLTHPNAAYTTFLTTVAQTSAGVPYCATAAGCTAPILNIPKDTASLALTYATKLFDEYQFTARLADVYVGRTYDESYYFAIELPAYAIANARVTLAHDAWSANLFVDNLTNKVALLTANNTSFQFNIPGLVRYSTNQPRTFGAQIDYKF